MFSVPHSFNKEKAVLSKSIIHWLEAVCASMLLTSCFETEMPCCDNVASAPSADGSYVKLSLSLQSNGYSNRPRTATPAPGEAGDGSMTGSYHENDINDLCLFVYNSPLGINSPASIPVRGKFIDNVGFHPGDNPAEVPVYTTGAVQMPNYIAKSGDHFVVVANMGDITGSVTTLGELRDFPVANSWQVSPSTFKEYTNFTMASADESSLTLEDAGGKRGSMENPILVEVPIERTAARIDFVLPTEAQAKLTDRGVEYSVTTTDGAATTEVAKAHITHVRVVNAMGGTPYLLKRTAATIGGAVTYLGVEEVANGKAANYVIEPTSGQKGSDKPDDATQLAWFGNSRFALYLAAGESPAEGEAPYFADAYKVRTSAAAGTTGFDFGFSSCQFEGEAHNYYLLGYVNENTMAPAHTTAWNATGLVICAKYTPSVVYTYPASSDDLHPVPDFADAGDGTFWRYRPQNAPADESRCLYFSSGEAAAAWAAAHPADAAIVTCYPGGVCYYNVWLRHANNDDSEEIGPMEFGIVRNNIYQVLIRSISGPGAATPNESGPENIHSIIYVRPWNVRRQPEIIV